MIKSETTSIAELFAFAFTSHRKRTGRETRPFTSVKMTGNPDGPLYGETIVFTGKTKIKGKDTRQKVAWSLAELGANIQDSITKKTTLLIVGDSKGEKPKVRKCWRLKIEF